MTDTKQRLAEPTAAEIAAADATYARKRAADTAKLKQAAQQMRTLTEMSEITAVLTRAKELLAGTEHGKAFYYNLNSLVTGADSLVGEIATIEAMPVIG